MHASEEKVGRARLPMPRATHNHVSIEFASGAEGIRCRWGIAALGRRQVGVAVGLRNVIVVASLQPGA
eukprot:COSAG05_NODE_221_length_13654_cov_29.450103_5_plen_68_part_00